VPEKNSNLGATHNQIDFLPHGFLDMHLDSAFDPQKPKNLTKAISMESD
jgi:hypothetical protein